MSRCPGEVILSTVGESAVLGESEPPRVMRNDPGYVLSRSSRPPQQLTRWR